MQLEEENVAVCRECGEGRCVCVCMRGIFNLIYNLLHFYNRVAQSDGGRCA